MKALSILFLALAVSGFADDFAEDPKGHFDSSDVWGPRFKTDPQHFPDFKPGTRRHLDSVRRWNEIAIDASGFDHANAREQLGPGRASRAMAIVHIAMFDTINAVIRQYDSYADFRAPSGAISLEAAVSQAAHDTLVALFPSQAANFDALLAEDLDDVQRPHARKNGMILGQRAAAAILALKAEDGSQIPEPRVGIEHITSDQPGRWRQDPISQIPLALGAYCGKCIPFVVESSSQFRIPPPPPMNSQAYTI